MTNTPNTPADHDYPYEPTDADIARMNKKSREMMDQRVRDEHGLPADFVIDWEIVEEKSLFDL